MTEDEKPIPRRLWWIALWLFAQAFFVFEILGILANIADALERIASK